MSKCFDIRKITIEDYDEIYVLWNATEQSRRALNSVDDSCIFLRRKDIARKKRARKANVKV